MKLKHLLRKLPIETIKLSILTFSKIIEKNYEIRVSQLIVISLQLIEQNNCKIKGYI